MDETTFTTDLVRRLRGQDPEAAEQLFRQYVQRLLPVAEQHLHQRLSARVDGEDAVQSAFRTFFRRVANGEFCIKNSAGLWRLLVTITIRKARRLYRFHSAEGRDVAAEAGGDMQGLLLEHLAQKPGPLEAAVLADQIEGVLKGLPEQYAHILEMRLQDYSVQEIARELRVSRQTIYRTLQFLQKRLEQGDSA